MKILVFCQRKQSFDKLDDYIVKDVVEQIEYFIKKIYGNDSNDLIFEYLTDGSYGIPKHLYDADHKMKFEINSKDEVTKNKTIQFINENRESYDMILLQTCPLLLIKNELPYLFETLKSNGIIIFSKFSYDKKYENIEDNIITDKVLNLILKEILETQFIKSENKSYTEYIKI